MTHYTQLQAGRLVDENLRLRRELGEARRCVMLFAEIAGELADELTDATDGTEGPWTDKLTAFRNLQEAVKP